MTPQLEADPGESQGRVGDRGDSQDRGRGDNRDQDQDVTVHRGPESARTGGGRTSRRAVIVAATGVLGAIGAAACTAPESTTANAPSRTPSNRGKDTGPGTGSAPVATESTPVTPAGTMSTSTTTSVLGTSGPDLQSGPVAGARVALTFHGAGAASLTATVLQIARAHDARLTVFAVGQWLAVNPQLGRAILAAGHDLGNHTWSHQPMRRLAGGAGAAAENASVRHELIARLFGTHRLLAGIANNVNQLARVANATGTVPLETEPTLAAARRTAERIDALVDQISEALR